MPPAPPWRPLLVHALALAAPGLAACTTDCGFEPRCEGNTVMDCTYGVDQLVGRGSPVVYPCLEPAPLCVEGRLPNASPDAPDFFCAREPLTPCDDAFAPRCEGTLHVFCQGGYVSAQDCTNGSGTGRCGQRTPELPPGCL
jgi:hypothetical protein